MNVRQTVDRASTQEEDATKAALKELFRLVYLEYEVLSASSPRNQRIAEVAKALCKQNGKHTEQITTGTPNWEPCIAGNNAVALLHPIQPAWATYWEEAVAAIDAVDGVRL